MNDLVLWTMESRTRLLSRSRAGKRWPNQECVPFFWQAFALGSAFFAGLTAILAKAGVAQINSNLATLIRTIVILLVALLIVAWRGDWEPLNKLSVRSVLFLCASGVATGLSWLCYFRALQLGPASSVAPIDKLSVVFVIFLAWMFLGEPLTWKIVVGGSLVATGALILALP